MGSDPHAFFDRAMRWHNRRSWRLSLYVFALSGAILALVFAMSAWSSIRTSSSFLPRPEWVLILAGILVLGWVRLLRCVIQQDDRRMRLLAKRCPWCNYERRISLEAPCPECGRLLAPIEANDSRAGR